MQLAGRVGLPKHWRTQTTHQHATVRCAAASAAEALSSTLGAQAHPLATAFLRQSMALYMARTPAVDASLEALTVRGSLPPNTWHHDHFAYRTLGLPGMGIASMTPVLSEQGYTLEEDGLLFKAKKLRAAWFAHAATRRAPSPLPRIFVSEIKVHELSADAQAIITKYAGAVSLGPAQVATACCTGALPWAPCTKAEYDALLQESDYAAWVMVHGYALNHTALSVHSARSTQGTGLHIADVARMMEQAGLTMNHDGGVIKVSPEGLLQQCSTMADPVPCTFSTGAGGTEVVQVPGSYVEMVERLVLPQFASLPAREVQEWHRREGFEVSNASHLFTSTRA